MNRPLMTIAAGIALGAAGLPAQTTRTIQGQVTIQPFQQITTYDYNGWTATMSAAGLGRVATIAGSPFSATEERKTVQTLSDGTQIERSDSDRVFRDGEGRTRVETTTAGKPHVTIVDQVAGFRAQLNPSERTATKAMIGAGGRRGGVGGGIVSPAIMPSVEYQAGREYQAMIDRGEKAQADAHTKEEDLGIQNQNGVPARGTRTTLTIPAGQIGNNRDIHVVNERWYSSELQMVVKTVNSDPRFGVTTYQLTNISRSAPDASMFQVPADYTVTESAGRGGARGGAGR